MQGKSERGRELNRLESKASHASVPTEDIWELQRGHVQRRDMSFPP